MKKLFGSNSNSKASHPFVTQEDTEIYLSCKVLKIDEKGNTEERCLLITRDKFYSLEERNTLKKGFGVFLGKSNNFKEKESFNIGSGNECVEGMTINRSNSDEYVIHIKNHKDYRYKDPKRL